MILRVGLTIVAQPGVESCLFHSQPRQSLSWIFNVNISWKATAFDYTARGGMVFWNVFRRMGITPKSCRNGVERSDFVLAVLSQLVLLLRSLMF